MKFRCLLALLLVLVHAQAIDIDAERRVAPDMTGGHGKKFSIFTGDPERIVKANEVDLKQVEIKLEAKPNPFTFAVGSNVTTRPELTFSLSVKNNGKRAFTLSFPTTQRYNLTLKNAAGVLVYDWVSDKEFMPVIGTIMVNPADRILYKEKLTEEDFGHTLPPGTYTVDMSLNNYPEIKAQATFVVL